MVYKMSNNQRCKDVAMTKNYSVINYLISFVVVCNRLQMENIFLHLIDFKFFTQPKYQPAIVPIARIAAEILFRKR